MADWYYAEGDERRGPVSAEDIKQRIQSGQLPQSTLVWEQSMKDWTPASGVAYLTSPGAIGPPPVVGEAAYAAATATYAGFWKRFAAFLIDFLITFTVGFVIGFVSAIVLLTASSLDSEAAAQVQVISNLIGLVIGWLYYAVFEASALQATPGKMALGIIVTDLDGKRIGFLRATGRHFAKILSVLTLMIGYILAGLTERKQALHDMIAGCLVVNKA